MEPLISIVVPVFNVDKYLNRCINSLVNQTYNNIEIILVDDGSTDSSGTMCDEWASRDDRIKVIHKKNAGLGYARNTGLEKCEGQYIVFVDSDDFVETNMLNVMLSSMLNNNANTCYCSYNIYSNETNTVVRRGEVRTGLFTGKEVLLDIVGSLPEEKSDFVKEMSVWACLFSKEIIMSNGLAFPSERDIICEDLPFDIQYLPLTESVYIIGENFYNYCINGESLTHKYDPKRYEKEKYLFKTIDERLKPVFKEDEYKIRLMRLYLGRIRASIVIEVKNSGLPMKVVCRDIKRVLHDEELKHTLAIYPYLKNPLKIRVFNMLMRYRIVAAVYMLSKIR